jgi:hypothetical protein
VKLNFGRIDDLQKESKVFREVFAMTDLHHPNIVRYSTCWVEVDIKTSEEKKSRRAQSLEKVSESSESDPSYNEQNEDRDVTESETYDMIQFGDSKAGDDIVFERSHSKQSESRSKTFKRRADKKHSSKILKTLTKVKFVLKANI